MSNDFTAGSLDNGVGFDQAKSTAAGRKRLRPQGGLAAGFRGTQRIFGDPNTVELWDDFIGDVVADQWNSLAGTDTLPPAAAILAGGIGGLLRFTTGNDGTGLAADSIQYTQALQWQASNGGLSIEGRFKLSAITTCYVFFGFTDLATTLEAPIMSAASADTFTTNASDAVGFMFDTRMTTDTWWLTGVKADTDATMINTGSAPVADTFAVFRIEVDAAGVATFFYNGASVGRMTAAITAATDLTPTLYVSKTSVTASMTLDLDYVNVSMVR